MALPQPGTERAFSMCYCGEEAALALTLRKMSYRNIQGAFFYSSGARRGSSGHEQRLELGLLSKSQAVTGFNLFFVLCAGD